MSLRPLWVVMPAVLAGLIFAASAQAANPTFAPYVGYSTGSPAGPGPAPQTTVAADFLGNGNQDVVTVNNSGFGSLILMKGNGNGTFQSAVTIPGTTGAEAIAVGDVNGDGRPDIVGETPSGVFVAINDGGGNFAVGKTYSEAFGAQFNVDLEDITGNGLLDIVVSSTNSIQTLLNNGNGTFTAGPTTVIPGASAISAITPAHIMSGPYGGLFAVDGATGTLYALEGTATGAFDVTGQVAGTGFIPEDVAAVDLTGNGIDDAAVVGSFSFTLATVLSNGQGGFEGSFTTDWQYAGQGPTSLAVGDLGGNGQPDLIVSDVANPFGPSLLVFAGNGTVKPALAGEFDTAPFPQDPAIADYNGDGKPDLAVAGPGTLSVLLNTTP